MAFRADEFARIETAQAENYLVSQLKEATAEERAESREAFWEIVREIGPAVDAYPTWHPLVSHNNSRDTVTLPSYGKRYKGLDHTRYFVHGFITCPYGDGNDVIEAVNALPANHAASITAKKLTVKFYHTMATPILVKCEWHKPLQSDGLIPLATAMPLLLEHELPCWTWSQVAETWNTMRPYFLGAPHGSRSSLFVSQETGQAMKKVWESIINTGMFGPIRV